MDCILLLLLLSCCGGWGNGSGCGCGGAMPCDNCGCRREARREPCNGGNTGLGNMNRQNFGRCPDVCGCEEVSEVRESSDCGCEQNNRDDNGPGLIPPPWQEYPKFSHREDGDDCES